MVGIRSPFSTQASPFPACHGSAGQRAEDCSLLGITQHTGVTGAHTTYHLHTSLPPLTWCARAPQMPAAGPGTQEAAGLGS